MFSDHAEDYRGISVIYVLSEVSHKVKENNEDSKLYGRLRRDGRSSLSALELARLPAAFGPANGLQDDQS